MVLLVTISHKWVALKIILPQIWEILEDQAVLQVDRPIMLVEEHKVHPEVKMLNTKESTEQETDRENTMVQVAKEANLEKT